MADLATINIEVVYDNTPMDKFIKSSSAAEAMVKRLDAALKAKTITMDEALRGLQEIEVYEKKNSIAVQDATRLEKESARVAKENAAIKAQAIKDVSNKAETAFALTMQRLKEEAALLKASASEQDRLRTKYDASYTAMKRYGQELNDLNAALARGVLTQGQYTAEQQKLSQSLAQGTGIFATHSTHVNQAKNGAQSLGLQVQQAGYQVGDFFVQVSSGTNPLVAFSQQATQLVGFFGGPWGAAFGAGIAIISAFAVAVFKNMDAIKTYEEVLKDLKGNFDALSATIDIIQDDNLEERFGNLTSVVKELATSVLELDRAMELRNLTLALDKLMSKNIEPTLFQKTMRGFLPGNELGVSQEELSKLTEQNYAGLGAKIPLEQFQIGKADILSTAKSGDVEATLTKIKDFFKQIKGDQPFTDMDTDLQDMLSTLSKVAIETAQVEAHYNGTAKAAKEVRDQDAEGAKYAADRLAFSLQENLIQEAILKYGKDSVEVDKQKGFLAAAKVEATLKEKFAKDGISQAEKEAIDQAMLAAYTHETNAGLIARQADHAQELAQGLREAATAMNALQGFSEGLDKQLGEAIARVNALKSGADAAVAGKISGLKFDLEQKTKEALAKGVDPSLVKAISGKSGQTIADLEAKLTEESKIKDEQSAAAKAAKGGLSTAKGGPSTDTIENKLQELYKYLDAQKQIEAYMIADEEIAYQQREDLLKSALDKKLITLQDYQMMERDLTARHQQELANIERTRQTTQFKDAGTFFGGMADLAKAGGDKTAKAVRVFSAAQALTNSYLAFTQILADPSLIGRPFARFGLAASALASGLSAVASIKGGGGGSISAGGQSSIGKSSPEQTAAPQTVIIQGIKPTDVFTGEQLSTLFDSLYKENRNRGMVFQVAR